MLLPVYAYARSSSVFDPATLALSGWWRASYSASPWTGVASAGSSSGRNLTEATNPPTAGTAQNGLSPAAFNGTNQLLTSSVNASSLLGASAGSLWCLFYAVSASADAGVGNRISNKGLVFQDTGGTIFGLGYSTSGVTVALYDGAYKEIALAAATATYHLAQLKYDGTNLKMRVNSGARTSVACGSVTFAAAPLVLGRNYATNFQNCRILEVGTSLVTLSDTDEDNVKSYVNSRYALSL